MAGHNDDGDGGNRTVPTTNDDHGFAHYPAKRGIDRRKREQPGINWSAIALVVTVTIWAMGGITGWFGANAQEVRQINERLTTLETQRAEDTRAAEQSRADIQKRLERIEDKVDRGNERR